MSLGRSSPGADHAPVLQPYGFDWERECNHRALLAEPMPIERSESLRVRRYCPDCRQRIELRMWQPTSGGWRLVVREIHAAGRSWSWIFDGKRWSIAL